MKESDIAFATASAEEHLLVPAIPHVRWRSVEANEPAGSQRYEGTKCKGAGRRPAVRTTTAKEPAGRRRYERRKASHGFAKPHLWRG